MVPVLAFAMACSSDDDDEDDDTYTCSMCKQDSAASSDDPFAFDGGGGAGDAGPLLPSEPVVWAVCAEGNTAGSFVRVAPSRLVFECLQTQPNTTAGKEQIVWVNKPTARTDFANHVPEVGRTILETTSDALTVPLPRNYFWEARAATDEGVLFAKRYQDATRTDGERIFFSTYEGKYSDHPLEDSFGSTFCIYHVPGHCVGVVASGLDERGVEEYGMWLQTLPPPLNDVAVRIVDEATCPVGAGHTSMLTPDHVYQPFGCTDGERLYEISYTGEKRLVATTKEQGTFLGLLAYGNGKLLGRSGRKLFAVSPVDGARQDLTEIDLATWSIATADDSAAYVVGSTATNGKERVLLKVPLDGSAVERITSNQRSASYVPVLDGEALYWKDIDETGRPVIMLRHR
jgi:hypothetical protein